MCGCSLEERQNKYQGIAAEDNYAATACYHICRMCVFRRFTDRHPANPVPVLIRHPREIPVVSAGTWF